MDPSALRRCSLRPIVLVLPALAVLASCSGSDPDRVLVVGDSVTGLVADDFVERGVDDDYRITLRATNGGTSGEMRETVAELDDRGYDQVILNLGTNDAIDDVPLEQTTVALGTLVARHDDASCIHLTTVNEHLLSFADPELPERVRRINGHLEALAADDERIDLIEWSEAVLAYQDRGEPDGSLLVDTVHPTAVGQRMLLDLYVAALEGCS